GEPIDQFLEPGKNERAKIETFGRIRFKASTVPDAYEYYLIYNGDKVIQKGDPHNGELSTDGKPTKPKPIAPANKTAFDYYPRFIDFRWMPVSGKYPIQY